MEVEREQELELVNGLKMSMKEAREKSSSPQSIKTVRWPVSTSN